MYAMEKKNPIEEVFLQACAIISKKIILEKPHYFCSGCRILALGQRDHTCLTAEQQPFELDEGHALNYLHTKKHEVMGAMLDIMIGEEAKEDWKTITGIEVLEFLRSTCLDEDPFHRIMRDSDWQYKIRSVMNPSFSDYEPSQDIGEDFEVDEVLPAEKI